MKIRILALSTLVGLASAGLTLADVVKGPDLTATGRVVSAGDASLVLRTDDHGHTIPFRIDASTELPQGVEPGSRVTVHYRAIGTDQQMAERIVLRCVSTTLRQSLLTFSEPPRAPRPARAACS